MTKIRTTLTIFAALFALWAVPAAAQSDDGGDRQPDRTAPADRPARSPERPQLRRRPQPDAPAPRPRQEPRNDPPRDTPAPTSFAPSPEVLWSFG